MFIHDIQTFDVYDNRTVRIYIVIVTSSQPSTYV